MDYWDFDNPKIWNFDKLTISKSDNIKFWCDENAMKELWYIYCGL